MDARRRSSTEPALALAQEGAAAACSSNKQAKMVLDVLCSMGTVAPVCYAHLAATQIGQWVKFEDTSETLSSHGGVTAAGVVAVPQLPKLKDEICNSMFFC
ncbi:Protein argonaute-4 [Dionaea muscipula]